MVDVKVIVAPLAQTELNPLIETVGTAPQVQFTLNENEVEAQFVPTTRAITVCAPVGTAGFKK